MMKKKSWLSYYNGKLFKRSWIHLILLSSVVASSVANAATWNIIYPRPLTEADQRARYPLQLLALALDQTGVKYRLIPSDRIYSYSKALKQLAENRVLKVLWSMTDAPKEQMLRPIRIPIYKGLIGWRLFFIKQDRQSIFANVNDFDDLSKLKPIQGHDWTDTKILQSNGFDVITSTDYLALFSMLSQEQGDFFPRSVVEIWNEVSGEDNFDNAAVESYVGLHYRTAMYFFVNNNNVTLARLIEDGLEKAIANGKFDKLFMQEHQSTLEKSGIADRAFFALNNPLLPEKTPVIRKELWYQPEGMKMPTY